MPTVLVTGAGRGIGRAISERLAAEGWDVLAGVRDPTHADGIGTPVRLDVTSADDLAALDAALPPRVDALVNNAGIVLSGPVEALDLDELRHQLEVNVTAQVAVTQALLPRLRESGGRIVFIGSVSGRVSSPLMGAYAASKFALEGITDALRLELRPWDIKVALVEPGAIDTALWQDALTTADEAEAKLSDAHRALYLERAQAMRKTIKRIQGSTSPPAKVADAVEHALTSSRPKPRYLVGTDAKAQVAMRAALPSRAFDAVLSRATGGR